MRMTVGVSMSVMMRIVFFIVLMRMIAHAELFYAPGTFGAAVRRP
jgi:hypothetical protein